MSKQDLTSQTYRPENNDNKTPTQSNAHMAESEVEVMTPKNI